MSFSEVLRAESFHIRCSQLRRVCSVNSRLRDALNKKVIGKLMEAKVRNDD